jgi:hypothetical protein
MLADTIRHGQTRGEYTVADVDADVVSVRVGSLMRGLAVHVALGGHEVDDHTMIEHTLHNASRELGCDLAELRAAAERQAAVHSV